MTWQNFTHTTPFSALLDISHLILFLCIISHFWKPSATELLNRCLMLFDYIVSHLLPALNLSDKRQEITSGYHWTSQHTAWHRPEHSAWAAHEKLIDISTFGGEGKTPLMNRGRIIIWPRRCAVLLKVLHTYGQKHTSTHFTFNQYQATQSKTLVEPFHHHHWYPNSTRIKTITDTFEGTAISVSQTNYCRKNDPLVIWQHAWIKTRWKEHVSDDGSAKRPLYS